MLSGIKKEKRFLYTGVRNFSVVMAQGFSVFKLHPLPQHRCQVQMISLRGGYTTTRCTLAHSKYNAAGQLHECSCFACVFYSNEFNYVFNA